MYVYYATILAGTIEMIVAKYGTGMYPRSQWNSKVEGNSLAGQTDLAYCLTVHSYHLSLFFL